MPAIAARDCIPLRRLPVIDEHLIAIIGVAVEHLGRSSVLLYTLIYAVLVMGTFGVVTGAGGKKVYRITEEIRIEGKIQKPEDLAAEDYRPWRMMGSIHRDFEQFQEAAHDYRAALPLPMSDSARLEIVIELADGAQAVLDLDGTRVTPTTRSRSTSTSRTVAISASVRGVGSINAGTEPLFVVDGKSGQVKRTVIYDQQGGTNKLSFLDVQQNKGVDDGKFKLRIVESSDVRIDAEVMTSGVLGSRTCGLSE